MTSKSIASGAAGSFFILWLAVLLAGADFPPPIGFIWIISLDAIAAGLVYYRVPTYINWMDTGKRGRWLCALLDGAAAGIIFALVTTLSNRTGEPSVPPPNVTEYLIWFTILGIVGAINAIGIYGIVNLLRRKMGVK